MCPHSFTIEGLVDRYGEPVSVPCGHCLVCRLSYHTMAIDRMFCEWTLHDVSAFVTFTYDDAHLRFNNGSINPTLSKTDVKSYLDKIRRHLKGIDYSYYLAGEYGDKFGRPHYHAIFFGLDYQAHANFFRDSWPHGSVMVLPVQPTAFRYVAKYIVSVESSEFRDSRYFDFGIEPPFRKMSRGLGLDVYRQHVDEIVDRGYFFHRGRRITINRYYFNKLVLRDINLIRRLDAEKHRLDAVRAFDASRAGMGPKTFQLRNSKVLESSLESTNLRTKSSIF